MGVSRLVGQLLTRRGLTSPDHARSFLQPKLTDLHDPSLLPGCDAAAERLEQAVRSGQPIVIYGDYDVDGISASAILWHMLRLANADVRCYLPHRVDEGYGLNTPALLELGRSTGNGSPLILTVDCGITGLEPARAAAEAGIELVITDHHEFDPANLPQAQVIVHPRLPGKGAPYPFSDLCGAGVALKLAWQWARRHCGSDRLPDVFRRTLLDMVSLAALGTVADVVPLVGENRVLTTFGLGQIKRTGLPGLNALIDVSNLRDEKIDAFHVGFVLGPRINACGRMGHAGDALKLLTEAGPDEGLRIAEFLCKENDRRRKVEQEVFQEARQMVLDHGFDQPDCRAIVLGKENWHPGVMGIVASRLVDAFSRPTVMLSLDNGKAHGSCRSVDGVPMHEVLASCTEHLESHGGHAMAAGLRLMTRNIDAFRQAMIQRVNQILAPDALARPLRLDLACRLEDLDLATVSQIARLAPFGRGNPAPVFCLPDVCVAQPPQRVGAAGRHLRLLLRSSAESACRQCWAVGFNQGHRADEWAAGLRVDAAVEAKVSTYRGRPGVDLHVQDLRLASQPASALNV